MECKQVCEYYYSYLEKAYESIPPAQLNHLQSCTACQHEVERLARSLAASAEKQNPASCHYLALHYRMVGQWVDCAAAKPFLPCLAMASLPLHVRTPITAHRDACSACRADHQAIASLHLSDEQLMEASRFLAGRGKLAEDICEQARTVLTAIRRRSLSGVATRASFSEPNDSNVLQVEIADLSSKRANVASVRMPRLIAATATAAILMVAALLFVRLPSVEALDLQRFYNALADAQAILIRTTVPEEDAPVQRIWISQTHGLRLFESPEKTVLYDVNTHRLFRRDSADSDVQAINVAAAGAPDHLQLPWGLLPFKDITQLSEHCQWTRLDEVSDERTVVYELFWTEALSADRVIEKKWVGFLDRATHLARTIHRYERLAGQSSWQLVMTAEVAYPEPSSVLEAVRSARFEGFYGDQM